MILLLFSILFWAGILEIVKAQTCWLPNLAEYPQSIRKFLVARKLSTSQQAQLSNAYSQSNLSMTLFKSNVVQIDSDYQLYVNNVQQCSTKSSSDINFIIYDDVWTCFNSGFVPISCNQIWELATNCGTYIQIHLPFDQKVISSKQVGQNKDLNMPINVPILDLCAGTYHIWLVYSTRIGRIIKAVKPIFISYPPCQC